MKRIVSASFIVGSVVLAANSQKVRHCINSGVAGKEARLMETQYHCSKDGGSTAFALAVSEEIENQSGSFSVTVIVEAEDTTHLFPDSVEILDSSIFQIALSQPELINAELSDFCKKIEKRRYI